MQKIAKKRKQKIEAIFEIYNGSAVAYHAPETSAKSISQICAKGSKIAKGINISSLIDEVRK